MPEYAYRAARPDGSITGGTLVADSESAALAEVSRSGLLPVSIELSAGAPEGRLAGVESAGRPTGIGLFSAAGVNQADVRSLTGELAIMLRAGLSPDRALRVLTEMGAKPAVAELIRDINRSVKAGKGLSQALAAHRELFGEFYVNMVKAGEAGGQLAEVLARLAEHLERVRELRDGVVSALIYPAILLVIALLSVALMMGFVVPQFETLFADMGEALPLPTRIIVTIGHFVSDWWWLLLLVAGAAVVGLRKWLNGPSGRGWLDRKLLGLPILGSIVRKYEITRFARSLGTLLGSGVPIVAAVRIASDTIGNGSIRAGVLGVPAAIKRGARVTEALGETRLFTPLAMNMIRLGEETGRLDSMLLEVARIHDSEVQSATKRALTLLEPAMILVLGAIVGSIIVSILMGILSVNDLAG